MKCTVKQTKYANCTLLHITLIKKVHEIYRKMQMSSIEINPNLIPPEDKWQPWENTWAAGLVNATALLLTCLVFCCVTGRRNRDRDPLGVTSDLVELQERWDAKQLAVRRLEQLQQQKPDPHMAFLLAVANKEVPAGTVWRKDTAAMEVTTSTPVETDQPSAGQRHPESRWDPTIPEDPPDQVWYPPVSQPGPGRVWYPPVSELGPGRVWYPPTTHGGGPGEEVFDYKLAGSAAGLHTSNLTKSSGVSSVCEDTLVARNKDETRKFLSRNGVHCRDAGIPKMASESTLPTRNLLHPRQNAPLRSVSTPDLAGFRRPLKANDELEDTGESDPNCVGDLDSLMTLSTPYDQKVDPCSPIPTASKESINLGLLETDIDDVNPESMSPEEHFTTMLESIGGQFGILSKGAEIPRQELFMSVPVRHLSGPVRTSSVRVSGRFSDPQHHSASLNPRRLRKSLGGTGSVSCFSPDEVIRDEEPTVIRTRSLDGPSVSSFIGSIHSSAFDASDEVSGQPSPAVIRLDTPRRRGGLHETAI